MIFKKKYGRSGFRRRGDERKEHKRIDVQNETTTLARNQDYMSRNPNEIVCS
jgi:hypothetical protein